MAVHTKGLQVRRVTDRAALEYRRDMVHLCPPQELTARLAYPGVTVEDMPPVAYAISPSCRSARLPKVHPSAPWGLVAPLVCPRAEGEGRRNVVPTGVVGAPLFESHVAA